MTALKAKRWQYKTVMFEKKQDKANNTILKKSTEINFEISTL